MQDLRSKIVAAILTFFVLVGIVALLIVGLHACFSSDSKKSRCDLLLKERHNLYLNPVFSDDTKAMLLPHLDSAIQCNCNNKK